MYDLARRPEVGLFASWPSFWWANFASFLATFITTTIFGSALVTSFHQGRPLDPDLIWPAYTHFLHFDQAVLSGLQFSVPLLLILLAHEFGHYVNCRKWHVDATLPFFFPSPSLFGTFGAFIRVKSPIFSRRGLFDIGIAGPLAGFVVLLPALVAGLALSRPMPPHAPASPFIFGTPLIFRLMENLFFPHRPTAQILLHPMAMSAWAGLLATAINLLPIGQLDGGHLVYATFGPQSHRVVSLITICSLAVLGFWYWTWWIWAVVLFFFGRRHPLIYDHDSIGAKRWVLVMAVCFVFLLSFCVVPVRVG